MDIQFFKQIDTEEKAYFLGLLYADGYNCVKGNYFSLQLQERDRDILTNFQQSLKSNYSLQRIITPNILHQNQSRLQINSKAMCIDLENLGCGQNKSHIITFPSFIEDDLLKHFIRGYFDGDGCFWEGKRKSIIVKNTNNTTRIRISHNVKFNITGNPAFIEKLQDYLVLKLKFSKTKIHYYRNSATLEYSGRLNMKKFADYIYDNSSVYICRKKEKYSKICANMQ